MATTQAASPISDKENRTTARRQFKPLSAEWTAQVKKHLNSGKGIIKEQIHVSNYELKILNKEVNINEAIVLQYLQCVCRYRNDQDQAVRPNGGPSCQVISLSTMELTLQDVADKTADIRNKLASIGCDGSKLMDLDYMFLPFRNKRWAHWALVGVSPKQKALFVIDSSRPLTSRLDYNDEKFPLRELKAILHQNSLSIPQGTQPQNWPVYTQWSVDEPADGSPPCKRQGDGHSCGIYTCTNAMYLAFRYDIMSIKSKYMMKKRSRMVAELINGGFHRPFDHQLLPIPDRMKRTWLSEMNQRYAVDDNGNPYEESDSGVDAAAQLDARVREKKNPRKQRRLEGHEEDWHPQFNPRIFHKRDFLYAVDQPMFQDLKTKEQLKQACRQHDFKKYIWRIKHSVDLFRAWMENCMAGRSAVAIRKPEMVKKRKSNEARRDRNNKIRKLR